MNISLMKLKKLYLKTLPILRNKFILTAIIFFIWITLFDQNNLIDRIKSINQLHKYEDDIDYYENKIKVDSLRLHELKTDRKNLEKYAREQYYLKKSDEEIFVIERN